MESSRKCWTTSSERSNLPENSSFNRLLYYIRCTPSKVLARSSSSRMYYWFVRSIIYFTFSRLRYRQYCSMPSACRYCPFRSKLVTNRVSAFITFFCDVFYALLSKELHSLLYDSLLGKLGKARRDIKMQAEVDLSSLWKQGERSEVLGYRPLCDLMSSVGAEELFPCSLVLTDENISLIACFLGQWIGFCISPTILRASLKAFTSSPGSTCYLLAACRMRVVRDSTFPSSPFQAQQAASREAKAYSSELQCGLSLRQRGRMEKDCSQQAMAQGMLRS